MALVESFSSVRAGPTRTLYVTTTALVKVLCYTKRVMNTRPCNLVASRAKVAFVSKCIHELRISTFLLYRVYPLVHVVGYLLESGRLAAWDSCAPWSDFCEFLNPDMTVVYLCFIT